MGWFGPKEKTPEDRFFEAIINSDGKWIIDDEAGYNTRMIHFMKEDGQIFTFSRKKTYLESDKHNQCINTDGIKRTMNMDADLYRRIESHAEDMVLLQETQRAGGYILDDDLRETINEARKVLDAGVQIEMLTAFVERIRAKHS